MNLHRRDNNALEVNPPVLNGRAADIAITSHGSNWYWAATALFFLLFLVFLGLSHRRPSVTRIFYRIAAALNLLAGIAYFTMASDLGFVPIVVEFVRSRQAPGFRRQVFYVRYILWFLQSAIQLVTLHTLAAAAWQTTAWAVLVDWVMVACALTGALVSTSYKWGYFTIALFLMFYLLAHLVISPRRNAGIVGTDVSRTFTMLLGLLALTGLMYPICWGLSEGGNRIHPDSEAAFYGVLDVLSIAVWSALLVWGTRDLDLARLGIRLAHEGVGKDGHGGARNGGGVTA